jgi:hypothetical protein
MSFVAQRGGVAPRHRSELRSNSATKFFAKTLLGAITDKRAIGSAAAVFEERAVGDLKAALE